VPLPVEPYVVQSSLAIFRKAASLLELRHCIPRQSGADLSPEEARASWTEYEVSAQGAGEILSSGPNQDNIVAVDERSDGMFPLITNCKDLSLKAILEAYKFQPKLEKRQEQLKSVQDLAPVWLKKVSRIEALLVHAPWIGRFGKGWSGRGWGAFLFILRRGNARCPVRRGGSISLRLCRDIVYAKPIGSFRSSSLSSVIFRGRSWISCACRLPCFDVSFE